jgi:hypothetical protein
MEVTNSEVLSNAGAKCLMFISGLRVKAVNTVILMVGFDHVDTLQVMTVMTRTV